MDKLKPFNKLPLLNFFQHDLERIHMAFRLSKTLRSDVGNIRAAGNEVEATVKDFYSRKLQPKYYVGDGHIVDSTLKISPQYDLIICENNKNPVLFSLTDKSELFFFEPVYCFAEIKRSFYSKKLLGEFSRNIARFKSELKRENVPPNFIETGSTGIMADTNLTTLPLRNPMLSFMFFVDSSELTMPFLKQYLAKTDKQHLPNFLVLLDQGIVVNLDKASLDSGFIKINLYPEFNKDESVWALMDLEGENNVLIYQYLLVIQHLNSTIVTTPNIQDYTGKLFSIDLSNITNL